MLLYDFEEAIAASVRRYAGTPRMRERTKAMSSSARTRAVSTDCSREGASLQIAAATIKVRKVEVLVYLRKCISAAKIRQCDTVTSRQWAILQQSYNEL
jgi:hypothetical protein